jgi:hypothetical protein
LKKRGGTLVAEAAAAPTTMSPAASDSGREDGGVFSLVRAVSMTASTAASNSWSDSSE